VRGRLKDSALLTLEGDTIMKGQQWRGVWYGGVTASSDCLAWNSNSRKDFGRSLSISNGRLVEMTVSCDSHMAIICLLTAP
jgi:hypothetical protein